MKHWTAKSSEDFRFAIAFNFVSQVEQVVDEEGISRKDLARRLGVSQGRVSQVINDPGNLTLKSIVEWSAVLGRKAAVVLYDDDDTENRYGPIDPDIFVHCWESLGKPRDFSDLEVEPCRDVGRGDYFVYVRSVAIAPISEPRTRLWEDVTPSRKLIAWGPIIQGELTNDSRDSTR